MRGSDDEAPQPLDPEEAIPAPIPVPAKNTAAVASVEDEAPDFFAVPDDFVALDDFAASPGSPPPAAPTTPSLTSTRPTRPAAR